MWWILQKRKYPSRYPSRFGVIPHDILTTHYQILHIIVETLAIVQMRLTWIWTGCIRNYIATYLALRRDASVITSGRTRCYVGTQFREQHWRLYGKNSIKNNRHWTEKTPKYRYFYGNIWQIMAIKKLLQYRYQLTIRLLPAYMAIWQFFYEKNPTEVFHHKKTS